MDNPEPRSQYLNAVLRQIERTAFRIPRFQREFVWGQRNILDLLESIEKGYPIGSVLTWRVGDADDYFSGFRTSPFPEPDGSLVAYEVVLDGAQRLSSLYGCLRNPSSHTMYQVSYNPRTRQFVYIEDSRDSEVLIPMGSLFDSRQFLAIQGQLAAQEDSEAVLQAALQLYSTFQEYQIPIIALANAPLEDVVEVFRRVNSTGTPLSPVDFVRALTWRSGFDLQETFDEFAERYEGTPVDGLTDDFLIKCLAVTSGLSLDARDVIRLKALADRDGGLTREVEAMRAALDKLVVTLGGLKVRALGEVPYEVQRLLLFAIMHLDAAVDPERIEQWFWRSTFAEEHQSRPDSYTSRLIRELRDGDVEPALAVRRPVDPYLLAARQRRAGTAATAGFTLLLRQLESRSLLSGEVVDDDGMQAMLFTRPELLSESAEQIVAPQVLANTVLLTPSDAARWKEMRRQGGTVADLYAACDAETGDAEEIWRSQRVDRTALDPPLAVAARSAQLLSEVVPGLEA